MVALVILSPIDVSQTDSAKKLTPTMSAQTLTLAFQTSKLEEIKANIKYAFQLEAMNAASRKASTARLKAGVASAPRETIACQILAGLTMIASTMISISARDPEKMSEMAGKESATLGQNSEIASHLFSAHPVFN